MGAENTRFNAKVYIDFIGSEGAPVLHMVDDTTHFKRNTIRRSPDSSLGMGNHTTVMGAVYTFLPTVLVFDDG